VFPLSHREEQVTALIRQGKANKIIAFELGLTTGTVKEYLFHIFKKLGVHNRTELAIWKPEQREGVTSESPADQ
jgi:DNA-binding NarL/FixJ family response regulator